MWEMWEFFIKCGQSFENVGNVGNVGPLGTLYLQCNTLPILPVADSWLAMHRKCYMSSFSMEFFVENVLMFIQDYARLPRKPSLDVEKVILFLHDYASISRGWGLHLENVKQFCSLYSVVLKLILTAQCCLWSWLVALPWRTQAVPYLVTWLSRSSSSYK